MKKIFLLLSIVFMYSCSTDELGSFMSIDGGSADSNNVYNTSTKINPPEWIQGKWKTEKGEEIEFTKSNLLSKGENGVYSALNNIGYYESLDKDAEVIENQTLTSYSFEYRDAASGKTYFNFIKISDTQMESKRGFKGIYTKK